MEVLPYGTEDRLIRKIQVLHLRPDSNMKKVNPDRKESYYSGGK